MDSKITNDKIPNDKRIPNDDRQWIVRYPMTRYLMITKYLIIIIIITVTMFMVLSSWQSHCVSSPGSFDECRMAPSGR